MALEIKQTCDRCHRERIINGASVDHRKKDGWRIIPVDKRFGEMRTEQPCLCPECIDFILHVIKAGPTAVVHFSPTTT